MVSRHDDKPSIMNSHLASDKCTARFVHFFLSHAFLKTFQVHTAIHSYFWQYLFYSLLTFQTKGFYQKKKKKLLNWIKKPCDLVIIDFFTYQDEEPIWFCAQIETR